MGSPHLSPMEKEDYCLDFDEEKFMCTNPDCSHHSKEHPGHCDHNMTKEEEAAWVKNHKEMSTFDTFPTTKKQPPSQEGE